MIKSIIFDIGGVLELGHPSKKSYRNHCNLGVHHFVANKLKISIDQYFDAIDTAYAKSITGEISRKKALKILSKNLRTSESNLKKLFISAYKKNFRKNKQLFEQAFKLKKIGYNIAILSDQWYLSKDALVQKNLFKNFDNVVISCDVGMRKPNPKIYKVILKKLNVKPSEALFIDNQQWNITPAKRLGMKTILFEYNKQLFEQPEWKMLWK